MLLHESNVTCLPHSACCCFYICIIVKLEKCQIVVAHLMLIKHTMAHGRWNFYYSSHLSVIMFIISVLILLHCPDGVWKNCRFSHGQKEFSMLSVRLNIFNITFINYDSATFPPDYTDVKSLLQRKRKSRWCSSPSNPLCGAVCTVLGNVHSVLNGLRLLDAETVHNKETL